MASVSEIGNWWVSVCEFSVGVAVRSGRISMKLEPRFTAGAELLVGCACWCWGGSHGFKFEFGVQLAVRTKDSSNKRMSRTVSTISFYTQSVKKAVER